MDTKQIYTNRQLSAGPVLIGLILILAVSGLYHQVRSYEFVSFDDGLYVTENYRVQKGLSRENLIWALTTTHASNWHPLTWASHMLDVELFGLDAGGHHLTNVYFHILNSLLLFWVLRRMSNDLWQSGFVAAVFAIHPLHVESVAWVSERKDVLSAFFWMLTIGSYARYVRRPDAVKYLMTLLLFILGLLAKPMGVTLPFVLLLLDYWPLGRIQLALASGNSLRRSFDRLRHLVVEKIPFFVITLASCIVTFYAQRSGGAVASLESFPPAVRISNALVAYVSYMAKMLRPVDLAVFYPYPASIPTWRVLAAAAVLISVFVIVLKAMKERPYLAVGWFWYFGTLIPVIGLVQIGGQAIADRYTYIPLIGLYIMVAWGVADLAKRWQYRRAGLSIITSVVLVVLMAITWTQIRYWKNSVRLFKHALAVNQTNWLAHNNLGTALAAEGKNFEAHQHFSEALRLNPDSAHVHVNMGTELLKQGRIEPAIGYLNKALNLKPDFPESHNILGLALLRQGKLEAAIGHFRMASRLKPDYAEARQNLNLALSNNEKLNRAAKNMLESMNFHPDDPDLDFKIKDLLEKKKALGQAINYFQKSLSLQPGFNKKDYYDIEIVAETKMSYDAMLRQFHQIRDQRPDIAEVYYHVACIYSRQGKIHASIKWLDLAIQKGFARWDLIKTDPDLDSIKASSYYLELDKS